MRYSIMFFLITVSAYTQDCNEKNWKDYFDRGNMNGCELPAINLSGVNLSGVEMIGINLKGAFHPIN